MPAATGTMYPVPLIPPDELYLSNFAWFDYIRPVDRYDLFEWRPKKAGTELKESVRHSAPKQRLSEIKKKRGIETPPSSSPEVEEPLPEVVEPTDTTRNIELPENIEQSEQ